MVPAFILSQGLGHPENSVTPETRAIHVRHPIRRRQVSPGPKEGATDSIWEGHLSRAAKAGSHFCRSVESSQQEACSGVTGPPVGSPGG